MKGEVFKGFNRRSGERGVSGYITFPKLVKIVFPKLAHKYQTHEFHASMKTMLQSEDEAGKAPTMQSQLQKRHLKEIKDIYDSLEKERDGCVSFKTVLDAFGGNGIFNDEELVAMMHAAAGRKSQKLKAAQAAAGMTKVSKAAKGFVASKIMMKLMEDEDDDPDEPTHQTPAVGDVVDVGQGADDSEGAVGSQPSVQSVETSVSALKGSTGIFRTLSGPKGEASADDGWAARKVSLSEMCEHNLPIFYLQGLPAAAHWRRRHAHLAAVYRHAKRILPCGQDGVAGGLCARVEEALRRSCPCERKAAQALVQEQMTLSGFGPRG